MIFLWGMARDPILQRIICELRSLAVGFWHLEQESVLNTAIELTTEGAVGGSIECDGERVQIASLSGAFVRNQSLGEVSSIRVAQDAGLDIRGAIETERRICSMLELLPARVMNRPSASATNWSKPAQLRLIAESGFKVPETIVTTDPGAALAFWSEHGEIIYKSISAVRSRVRRLHLTERARLENVKHCPVQFQEWIPGKDVRVHVVGSEVMACEISAGSDDYRYPPRGFPTDINTLILPADVRSRCRSLTKALGLEIGGIDLRRTPKGAWYCFEVNPSPSFSYFERGVNLGRAIALLLSQPMAY